MGHIRITACPKPRPMLAKYAFMAYLLAGPMLFLIRYLLAPSAQQLAEFMIMTVVMALASIVLLPILWRAWQWNRQLPRRREAYLSSGLAAKDYAQFAQAARDYPEVRPWIAAVYRDGVMTYREALPLQRRVNQYLDALPNRRLDELLGGPDASGQS